MLMMILSVGMALSACQSLPITPHLPKSEQLTERVHLAHQQLSNASGTDADNPSLNTIIDEQSEYYPTLSGYYPIATGADAFAARSILSDMASHTIDVQYYIWHDDEAGVLMLKDLWHAAERGVLIRLLLDDFNSNPNLDEQLLLFAKHPNIAVRVVNPFVYRRYRFVNYLTSPVRINRRMHNKKHDL